MLSIDFFYKRHRLPVRDGRYHPDNDTRASVRYGLSNFDLLCIDTTKYQADARVSSDYLQS